MTPEGIKKSNWNETNEAILANKISLVNSKKEKNNISKENKVEKPKKLDIENFTIDIADNGRKFRGEMSVEKKSIKYEKKSKNLKTKLSLSPNQVINLKAEYPKRDWNNINKPINGRPLSIECNNKHVFHADCIKTWISKKTICPMCRADLVPDSDDENNNVNVL